MSERITLVNPYVIYECPDCGVKVATDSPDSVPDCPDCGLLGVALEFVGLGEFISSESKAEIERLRRERETLLSLLRQVDVVMDGAAMMGVGSIMAPRYRDDWAVVHTRVREHLALLDGEKGGDADE